MTTVLVVLSVFVVLIAVLVGMSVRVLREYERAVVFRLGRLITLEGSWSGDSGAGDRSHGAGQSANRHAEDTGPRSDHSRQRPREGHRRHVLSGRRR